MNTIATPAHPLPMPSDTIPRRDFMTLLALAGAGVGAGAIVWPFVDSMEPAADTLAAGEPVDIDIGKIAAGQQIVVMWRGNPIFVSRRSPDGIAGLQDPSLVARLRDPGSSVAQQPGYAHNWHRSIRPDVAVLVGICTHLGCVPNFYPAPSASNPVTNWPGGYFCPCHGSRYDLAGRVHQGVPAPYNTNRPKG